jgi:hypothetical protein
MEATGETGPLEATDRTSVEDVIASEDEPDVAGLWFPDPFSVGEARVDPSPGPSGASTPLGDDEVEEPELPAIVPPSVGLVPPG